MLTPHLSAVVRYIQDLTGLGTAELTIWLGVIKGFLKVGTERRQHNATNGGDDDDRGEGADLAASSRG